VSARLDDTTAGADAGSAYVFEQDEGGPANWGQVALVFAEGAAAGDQFGMDLKLSGDSLVASSIYHDLPEAADAGAIYVFGRHQGGTEHWGQTGIAVASDAAAGDYFGQFMAWNGSTLAASARIKDTAAGVDAG
jgi:hypothetical protein